MKFPCLLAVVLLACSLALSGCQSSPPDKQKSSNDGYDVKGKIVSVDAGKPGVTLDHEDIPGLMKAMTMQFRVEDSKMVEGLKAGDQVQGRVKKTDSGYVITRLEKR